MKEKSATDELTKLSEFKATRNEWFTKEEKKKMSRKTTSKVQAEEGSSSQLKKKRQKKVVETMLVDEPEENVERDEDPVSPTMEQVLKDINYGLGTGETAGEEGDDVEKSSSDSELDETERWKKLRIKLKSKPIPQPPSEPQQSPPQQSVPDPIQSPPKQPSPSKQPSPPPSSPHLRISTPTHEQPVITSPHILQTPPTTQPHVHTTPGSSSLKDFPPIPENIRLEDIGDFNFLTDDVVKRLQKKVEEVIVENKRLVDREKKLEGRVKTVEAENSSLLKKEEKARRDEQNEYFKQKNKELESINAKKEHELYMINKVLENLIKKPVEQRFEEIELEEVRARRKAEIEAEMMNKGKGVQVEDVSEVTERAIVLSVVPESSTLNPCPISAVSGVFDEDVDIDDVVDDDDEEEDEEEDDEEVNKGIKVTEASTEENVDDYLHDDANEEPENAESEGEHDDTKNVDEYNDHVSRLILRLEHGMKMNSSLILKKN
ncbi:hypothetical protein Hanom_Chr10g00937101 [Helianthus anomalus]